MTTGISLVRENAASMSPPRSLWVTFPLGRPLGKPNDPAFQHDVISAALDLLNRQQGPVLEDYPLDAPSVEIDESPACPVSFPGKERASDTWRGRLLDELELLKPWHDLSRRRRKGRTTVGVSATDIDSILERLGLLLDDDRLPVDDLGWFKLAIEDAKAFYTESLTAQPGEYDPARIQKILWDETSLGAALRTFYGAFQNHPRLSLIARIVAPREAIGASTGEEVEIGPDDLRNDE